MVGEPRMGALRKSSLPQIARGGSDMKWRAFLVIKVRASAPEAGLCAKSPIRAAYPDAHRKRKKNHPQRRPSISHLGFRVISFTVQGLGFKVQGLGIRV